MYTYLDKCGKGTYRFVYNTEDRSVRYMKWSDIDFEVRGSKSIAGYGITSKLKLLGFELDDFSDDLFYAVCSYYIGDVLISLLLVVKDGYDGNNCYILLKFFEMLSENLLSAYFINSKELYNFDGIYGFDSGMTNKLRLHIPAEMVDYILNLKSRHDFDGLMQAFSGLIGTKISEIIEVDKKIDVTRLRFNVWFDKRL